MKRIDLVFFILILLLVFPIIAFAQAVGVGPVDGLIAWLMTFDWWIYVASFVAIASAVAAVLPSTVKESPVWSIAMKIINMVALNIAKAKSADDKTKIKIE